jgi:hypothetical protein
VFTATANAASFPAKAPKEWAPPNDWLKGALCIHRQEGAWDAATGNGYEGGMQFARATWVAMGGAVAGAHWASVASKREQLFRAWLLWQAAGGSWRHWGGAATGCGLS